MAPLAFAASISRSSVVTALFAIISAFTKRSTCCNCSKVTGWSLAKSKRKISLATKEPFVVHVNLRFDEGQHVIGELQSGYVQLLHECLL